MTSLSQLNLKKTAKDALPVYLVAQGGLNDISGLSKSQLGWAKANDFVGRLGQILTLPDEAGQRAGVLFGLGGDGAASPLVIGQLASQLAKGTYVLANPPADAAALDMAALGFALGTYRYDDYRSEAGEAAKLVLPKGCDVTHVTRVAGSVKMIRDLVNKPANDLGPELLEKKFKELAKDYGAKATAIVGDALLKKNFPLIHAVGRASVQAPRLLDMVWGKPGDPKVTLVGKGVTFDTGGLNVKLGASMALMKKDMGGAANILGLARMIMDAKLPVRLRVLVPAVENSIAGNAFRPGDVLPSRKGITVEIGNTDAEGRLVLADALALADEESPEILIDMATLTGAARIALGPELPPFYCDDRGFVSEVCAAGETIEDPVWHMPLWAPYRELLASKIADINHISSGGGLAGSVTAALFLQRFVENAAIWAHFDIFAWAPKPRPGRPFGGTDQAARAVFATLSARFGK